MRTKWQSGTGSGNAPALALNGNSRPATGAATGEIQPDLSRRLYSVCCHHSLEILGLWARPTDFSVSGGDILSANHTEPPSKGKRKKKNSHIRWIVTVFFVAVVISSTISFFSSTVLEGAGLVEAFLVLLLIVALGIVFDIIGVAVMSAEEKPSMPWPAKRSRCCRGSAPAAQCGKGLELLQ